MVRKYFAFNKKTLAAAIACITGLVAVVVILTPSADVQAAGMFEIETNFYTCPENASSLAQCTHNGMRLRDCHGNLMTEGTFTGNYKVNHSEMCNPPHIGSGGCVFYSSPTGWVQVACYP